MRNENAFLVVVEGKESNFILKRGWLFQNGKEEKHRTKSEYKISCRRFVGK